MEKPHFPLSLFTAGFLGLLAVVVLTMASTLYATETDIAGLKARANQGDARAQFNLGLKYVDGEGVRKDAVEAAKWFRKAAEQGYAEAQCNLGVKYSKGEGVRKDAQEAVKWYRKAAEQGDAKAEFNLGLKYVDGEGVRKDAAEAAKWFRKAAEQGYADAQFNVGFMYENGKGVRKDDAEAAKWYRKAAEQGDTDAQNNLGLMYADGKGVPKNYVEAYKWANLAAAGGIEQAAKWRRLLEGRMTSEQIAEAQRLSARFASQKAGAPPELNPSLPTISASGTAFFVTEDGYALTSYHVLREATRIELTTDRGALPARLIKADVANDLALIKVSGKFAALSVQPSRGVELGDTVLTVGFPNITLQGLEPKLTEGKISSLSGLQDDPRYFQISVAVQPGNSGGALANSKGNVVGVVAAKLSELATLAISGSLPENVNYAVKSSYALLLLESVPDAAAKLKGPSTKEQKFEDVVKEVATASALVIVEK